MLRIEISQVFVYQNLVTEGSSDYPFIYHVHLTFNFPYPNDETVAVPQEIKFGVYRADDFESMLKMEIQEILPHVVNGLNFRGQTLTVEVSTGEETVLEENLND